MGKCAGFPVLASERMLCVYHHVHVGRSTLPTWSLSRALIRLEPNRSISHYQISIIIIGQRAAEQ